MDPAQYQPKCPHFFNLQDGMPAKFQNRKAEGGVDPAQYQAECRHVFLFSRRNVSSNRSQNGPKMESKGGPDRVWVRGGLRGVIWGASGGLREGLLAVLDPPK